MSLRQSGVEHEFEEPSKSFFAQTIDSLNLVGRTPPIACAFFNSYDYRAVMRFESHRTYVRANPYSVPSPWVRRKKREKRKVKKISKDIFPSTL